MDAEIARTPTIFISHAAEDKRAVDLLSDWILGEGAGRIDVFCTSSPGHGIPSGARFFDYIKDVLERSTLVVHFISPAFLRSSFCMLELGAAWAQGKSFALRTPTLTDDEIGGTAVASLQLAPLDSGDGLDELRDKIGDLFQLPLRARQWAERRSRTLRSIVEALPGPAAPPVTRLASVGVREHHLEAWALTADGRISHSWWPDDDGARVWNRPYDFDAPRTMADLAAVSRAADHCEVFAVDSQGTAWHRWWNRAEGWHSWRKFHDQRIAPPISACSYQEGQIEVFARDRDTGLVIHAWSWNPGEWSDWDQLSDFVPA